jgi:phosphodiesterase/alkaline phosphatase D-like protein
MKRTTRLLAAVAGVTATVTGVALAASSPTVATRAATEITNNTAVLNGAVNPNGNQTTYTFAYGPTTALGAVTAPHSVGHGTKPHPVAEKITGLTPGTQYFYQLSASNKSGSTTGALRQFTTTGHPLPAPTTGPTVSVGKNEATPTGSVNPNGAPVSVRIQYGLTIQYGYETFSQSIAPGITPVPVSAVLTGLAPGKLFHYRVAATRGVYTTYGADATFFTYPAFRRTPRMSTHTSPGRVTRKPYTFTTSGSLAGAGFVPSSLRCTGTVGIRYHHGNRQVAYAVAPVGPDCRFSTPVPFSRLIKGGPAALTIAIHYRGNGYLKPVDRTNHVTLG